MSSQHIQRKVFALLLIPAMLWLFFNASANWHYHKLPTGEVVKHSHPFSPSPNNNTPSPFQGHEHSAQEFSCLDQYANPDASNSQDGDGINYFQSTQELILQTIPAPPSLASALPKNILRGPPSVS